MIPKERRTDRAKQLFDAPAAKPEYRVPPMAEVAVVPWNGLTVVSTFAGAGGSSLGWRMAGYRVLWASEFMPIAGESYLANAGPGTVLDPRDVKKVTAAEVLKAIEMKPGDLDVLDGSPPCQAFSTAGKREKGWGTERKYANGSTQKNEELFSEFVRLRDGLMPRAFVAENVSGLVKGTAKGFFLEILAELKRGYRVEARVLDAQWLGVPQQRQRVIFVGVREDLGLEPAFPSPLPYRYSVRDALPWLGGGWVEGANGYNGHAPSHAGVPLPTVQAGRPDRATSEQIVMQKAKYDREVDVTDRPALTIRSSDGSKAGQEITVRHGSAAGHSKHRGKAIDRDAPMPAVMARFDGRGGSQFDVEAKVVFRGNSGNHVYGERRQSADLPSPCVQAKGLGSAGLSQAFIEERLVQGPEVDQRNEGRPIDPNEPAPAVAAGNAAKRTPRQFVVERVVHGTGGLDRSPKTITDRPAPTITVGHANYTHFGVERVIHDTGRPNVPAKDVTDLPCPAVTAGPSDPATGGGPRNHFQVEARRVSTAAEQPDNVAPTFEHAAIGREYDRLNPGQSSDKYMSLVRADASKPCPTVTAEGGNTAAVAGVVHPTEKRKFSIAELRRICAFPDDFVLKGSYAQQWEQLGNSVPPLMMRAVAEALRDRVLLPARARTGGRGGRSRGRSTSARSPRDAARPRP